MNNVFLDLNQAIKLQYWHNGCPANKTLDCLFVAVIHFSPSF